MGDNHGKIEEEIYDLKNLISRMQKDKGDTFNLKIKL
jgi:hypothetical protein